jgi:methionine biosynthesis protein MetW
MRPDQKIVAGLIPKNSRVLDIGSGTGQLLEYLEEYKNVKGYGLEIDAERVAASMSRGLSVIQGDADEALKYYPDQGFDYAVLALTLQAMRHPKAVLQELLRIAEKVIVTIPNFGHVENRLQLITQGKMPVTSELSYSWYETPNIHFCTIRDFLSLAKELSCTIEQQLYITGVDNPKSFSGTTLWKANLFGRQGIFVLSKSN